MSASRVVPSPWSSKRLYRRAPPLLAPLGSDDSGTLGDNITNVRQPHLIGTATPGTSLQLLSAGSILGSAIIGSNGSYSIQPTTSLVDGTYTLTATATDIAGNVSAVIAPFILVIKATPPVAPTTPLLLTSDDSGTLGDNITNVRQPHLSGTATPGTTVQILREGTALGSVLVGSNWSYSIQPTTSLSDGTYTLQPLRQPTSPGTSAPRVVRSPWSSRRLHPPRLRHRARPGGRYRHRGRWYHQRPSAAPDRHSHAGDGPDRGRRDHRGVGPGIAQRGVLRRFRQCVDRRHVLRPGSGGGRRRERQHVEPGIPPDDPDARDAAAHTRRARAARLGRFGDGGRRYHQCPTASPGRHGHAGGDHRIVSGSTVLGSTTAASNGTYSVPFASPLIDGTYTVSVQAVVAGTASASSPTLTLTIDATPPAVPAEPGPRGRLGHSRRRDHKRPPAPPHRHRDGRNHRADRQRIDRGWIGNSQPDGELRGPRSPVR